MRLHILTIATAALMLTACSADTPEQRASRRLNAEGNEHYAADRYADAEASYTKAVGSDAANQEAKYNLALSMIRQARAGESGKKLLEEARQILADVAENSSADSLLRSASAYNIGNMAYNVEQYDPAIAAYKSSLRLNPDDDIARENLRLAQLKKREQEQNKNDDKQNQDQDKQNQDQDKQQQQNQQQQQQQQQQDNNQQQQQQQQQQQPQQPQGSISNENAEKILKAMENEEAATRRRIQEAEKRKAAAAGRRTVTNPW